MTTTFFTAITVLLAAAGACGWITRRLGLTQTVGELAGGVLVGPTVLGHVWPSLQHGLFPADVLPPIQYSLKPGDFKAQCLSMKDAGANYAFLANTGGSTISLLKSCETVGVNTSSWATSGRWTRTR